MAKNEIKNDPRATHDLRVTMTPEPSLSDASSDREAVKARLEFLELQEKEEIYKQKLDKKKQELAHRRMNADNEKKKNILREAAQRSCTHMKKNGETYLAGQRDHSGNLHLLCQFCMKHFYGHEVPAHLRPEALRVGGPEVVAGPSEREAQLSMYSQPVESPEPLPQLATQIGNLGGVSPLALSEL